MHRQLSRGRREEGAVAIIVAVSLTALLVGVAMVLDFGLVRVDRQVDKSAADAAVSAGLHGLNGGDGAPHPFMGVCTALRYLQRNNDRFKNMSDTTGTWTTATGTATANGCIDTTLRGQVCNASDQSTWARFAWTGSMDGKPLNVTIQSGYQLSAGSGWSEDTLTTSTADQDDQASGCDQLAVIVSQSRTAGLGSLATTADLKTAVRSVGRVETRSGDYAPAMLLLEQHTCPVLESGSNSGVSFIHVLGSRSSDGRTQPGSIHSDSDAGTSCSGGSNQNLFLGKGDNGVVAYAAPLSTDLNTPDPSKPGQLSSVAGYLGKALNFVIDNSGSLTSAYAATGLNASSPGTHKAPIGLGQVTRKTVDKRYFTGVKGAVSAAAGVFSTVTAANATSLGYTKLASSGPTDACKPTQAEIDALALTATSKLYVDCPGTFVGPNADLTIPAGTILFNGSVAPKLIHSLPNAQKVYIAGNGTNSLDVGNNSGFKMHTSGRLDASSNCSSGLSSSKAEMFIKDGYMRESGTGQIQLCNVTVVLMGGRSDACIPSSVGTAPTATPCGGGLGTGQFTQQGGSIDWTAPNQYDLTTDLNGDPLPDLIAPGGGWNDPNGPEDLALWSESASNSSNTYNMNGSGNFFVRGVFMVPNANPFTIGGGASLNLTNAQFIARTVALNGTNTNITMSVDANSAVTLPKLVPIGLVR